MFKRAAMFAFLALLAACAPATRQATPVTVFTPPPPEVVVQKDPAATPSLFDPDRANYLFTDNRARAIGDIVVVNIVESVSASNKHQLSHRRILPLILEWRIFLANHE